MNPDDFLRQFTPLCDRLAQLGDPWEHDDQPPTEEDLGRLEHALGGRFPASYRAFLLVYGGGSVPTCHLHHCRVRRGDPLNEEEGQVYGQTLHNRNYFALPLGLAVIEQQLNNDRCACLAMSGPAEGPVLSYMLDERITVVYAENFAIYLLRRFQAFIHLGERAQAGKRS